MGAPRSASTLAPQPRLSPKSRPARSDTRSGGPQQSKVEQMAAILARAKIVSASLSVHVRLRSTSDLPPPCFGITVDLKARGAQAVNAVPVDIAFPGKELIDREFVEPARLLDWNPAAAHSLDNRRLTPYRPPSAQRRQLRHRAERICIIGVIRRACVPQQFEECRSLHVIPLSQ